MVGSGGYFHRKDECKGRAVDEGGYFRTNRSCPRSPAHQEVKTPSCDFFRRIRTEDFATAKPNPSGARAPRTPRRICLWHDLRPRYILRVDVGYLVCPSSIPGRFAKRLYSDP